MSRPNVIPTFRQRRCTNRGRNFVRSKRRSTYTSSGTLYLFLRLNNSETIVRKCVLSAAVEGKNRPVATNFQFLKIFCPSGTSLLQCVLRVSEVILLGRACPKPCLERTRRNCVNLTQFLQLIERNRVFPTGNALLYISLLSVVFGRVRPIQGRTLFLF